MNRADILERVKKRTEPWDFIVIGGGATGVGCAVDAADRGFDVLLLEQSDFGKGTSSRSTKLVHGGVRYLAQGNISLVREALKERGLLFKNAPHVVHKQAFVVPCYSLWQKFFYGIGLKFYDLLSGKYGIGKSKILSKAETLDQLPNLKPIGLRGGVLYFDGQFDDTRLLIDLVATAYEHGASVLNYARVSSFQKNESGAVMGVEFENAFMGERFTTNAKVIINATGAFCDEVRAMSEPEAKKLVTPSQGIHLVFDRQFLRGQSALMIPKTSDGRVLFAIPWREHLLVGTTDTPVDHASLEPTAQKAEIDFILKTIREYLAAPPTEEDILSVFAGIRPLVKKSAAKNTAALSRDHTIEIDRSGLLTVTGGKWTTYRRMAEDAVDQAIANAGLPERKSSTMNLKIQDSNTPEDSKNTNKLHPDLPYTDDDVIRAVRQQMAQTVEDVLARRTRALFLNAEAAIEIAPRVAEIMCREFGKAEEWAAQQIADFNHTAQNYVVP